ncbi:hypothetical protein WI87_18835 [Burkholderia ubonensis]|uniref:hypothetical protein n=1 Tax=Burkholderia ubonensis TaxID=101571 RepID=UPI0007520DE2|nr:hypothetical protein [Burkholderia ubonensis]KVD57298.1 hypothetical protein WI87_18835 [Burkholderia ubonensis]
MSHRIHLADVYEGRELDSIAREVEGGFVLVAQLARKVDDRTTMLVTIENPDTVYPSLDAVRAASFAALKMSIDGGFA